jgi:cell division septal protein FtsQ
LARRRIDDEGDFLPGLDVPEEGRSNTARARTERPRSDRPRIRGVAPPVDTISRVKVALRVLAVVVVIGAGMYGFHKVEQFLIRDPRFALNGIDGAASTLEIRGASHASAHALESTFRNDSGRSVYLMPLGDRRSTLRAVDWVKDAAVVRAWPNHVYVHVSERVPVAFVTLGASQFGLIDEDGVILPPAPDRFHLPVLTGVGQGDSPESRKRSVRRMMSLLSKLGDSATNVAEVDVTDSSNLKVKQSSGGRMITLLLGDKNYDARYRNFANHFGEIQQKLPGAATLDLRIEDRITVVEQ